ncbi:MAG: acetyl-CoA carboxylase carboxyl transferase subunit beta, partial [Bacteroidia bacterium]
MSWFKRVKDGILTKTQDKKPTPDGLWYKCKECKEPTSTKEFEQNLWVCPSCNNHGRIGSREYFNILFDNGKFKEMDAGMTSGDPLNFSDTK